MPQAATSKGKNPIKRYYKKGKKAMDKKYSGWDLAKKALDGVMYLKGMINCERKVHDATVNSTFDYTGAVNCLTQIAGGSGDQQRNGNSVLLRGLLVRGRIALDSLATNNTIRIFIVQDNSTDPGTLTTANVLEQVGTIYAPFSPLNQDNRRRFKILGSKLLTISTGGNANQAFKFWIPLHTHCRWNSTTATDYDKGHLYTCIVSNTNANLPAVTFYSRVYYYDN